MPLGLEQDLKRVKALVTQIVLELDEQDLEQHKRICLINDSPERGFFLWKKFILEI